jgi:D-glycero-D-manno-heptose 1,7-bisphosphate phosphatase
MNDRPPLTVAFLDRDGTLNVKADEGDYVTTPGKLVLLDGAARAVRALNDAGVLTVIVTNQRGVARGIMSRGDVDAVHARLRELLAAEAGARIDHIEVCPHENGTCMCRKPLPGLFLQAAAALSGVDVRTSAVFGDSRSDVDAGATFGVQGWLLGVDCDDLDQAVGEYLRWRKTGLERQPRR